MMRLARLQSLPALRVCGIMSGTSLDGIDVAIVQIAADGDPGSLRIDAFHTAPFDAAQRAELHALQHTRDVSAITRATIALGHLFADAVRATCDVYGIAMTSIDLIGSHGLTVSHAPDLRTVLARPTRGTLQIGAPAVIAADTGIVTVGDFRAGDCAVGGEGAPLMPAADYLLFRSPTIDRVMLNIGGIANVTILPAGCAMHDVGGFDTGPGNMVIDALCARWYGDACDRDAGHAASGAVLPALLEALLRDEYFARTPPKSTGRERYGAPFVDAMIARAGDAAHDDVIATATEFTARTIALACRDFIAPRMPIDEVIVSGGGAHNPIIMRRLKELLAPAVIVTSSDRGIPVDAKEAVGFALLANETIHERASNIPAVTGAARANVLGSICL